MTYKNKIAIPLKFVLVISGMPGVGKTTLAINLIKKYREFRSINQMNLLRFATRYYDVHPCNNNNYEEGKIGLRFVSYEEGQRHMHKLAPIIKAFIERQLLKKIPTILEGVDFYPPVMCSDPSNENVFNRVLFINLYCSDAQIHYTRLTERELDRQGNPSKVDTYFDNIRNKNELLHNDIIRLGRNNIKSFDIKNLSEKEVMQVVENMIQHHIAWLSKI